MPLVSAPVMSDLDLRRGRDRAEALFAAHRREEGPLSFERAYVELKPRVEMVFAATDNLTRIEGELFIDDPDAWQACRYVCGPPISQEDLWTLVGSTKFKRVPPAIAADVAHAIQVVIDPVRFGWVSEGRQPDSYELRSAIMATTVLWAAQHLATQRRRDSSGVQEERTGLCLGEAGLKFDPSRSPIDFMDDMARGTYSRERRIQYTREGKISGAKCDVPARLRDGRLFALECKVSNGPKNGWKRVNREVAGKATDWREGFGTHILTGVVLGGVFDLSSLRAAQGRGVLIFWEHDMRPLEDFVASAV